MHKHAVFLFHIGEVRKRTLKLHKESESFFRGMFSTLQLGTELRTNFAYMELSDRILPNRIHFRCNRGSNTLDPHRDLVNR